MDSGDDNYMITNRNGEHVAEHLRIETDGAVRLSSEHEKLTALVDECERQIRWLSQRQRVALKLLQTCEELLDEARAADVLCDDDKRERPEPLEPWVSPQTGFAS